MTWTYLCSSGWWFVPRLEQFSNKFPSALSPTVLWCLQLIFLSSFVVAFFIVLCKVHRCNKMGISASIWAARAAHKMLVTHPWRIVFNLQAQHYKCTLSLCSSQVCQIQDLKSNLVNISALFLFLPVFQRPAEEFRLPAFTGSLSPVFI